MLGPPSLGASVSPSALGGEEQRRCEEARESPCDRGDPPGSGARTSITTAAGDVSAPPTAEFGPKLPPQQERVSRKSHNCRCHAVTLDRASTPPR